MKKISILLLFTFGCKIQGSFRKDLDLNALKEAQEFFEIQQAYKTLSPLKNETPNFALACSLRAYEEDMPYMQYVSKEEKHKQKKELKKAYNVLKEHGLHDKSPEEIKIILARKLSPEQFIGSPNNNNDDDASYEVIDEACEFSQRSTQSYDQQNKFEESAILIGTSFYSCSQDDQMQNENLSLSFNDFVEHEDKKIKFNSIEEALNVLRLTQETCAKVFIQHQKSFLS